MKEKILEVLDDKKDAISLIELNDLMGLKTADELKELSEELIKLEIERWIDETYSIEVIKTEGKLEFTILVDGIELDEEESKLDLTGLR